MKVVKINVTGEFIGEKYLKESPLKTDKVLFNVYNFKPWQALGMHKHPANDEIFYAVDGRCLFFLEGESRAIEENMAIYVPSNARHAILSLERDAVLISVIGPPPVESVYSGGMEYYCPVCDLETPTTVSPEYTTACPRCHTKIKLAMEGSLIVATEISSETSPGAEAR